MQLLPFLLYRLRHGSIVLQIMIGLVAGMALALLSPEAAKSVAFLGTLFVKALKGVAPILVFVLVATSIAGKLGVNIEGFAKNIGEASGGTTTGIGKALDRLRKK